MSKYLSAKYYQNNKERLQKKSWEKYLLVFRGNKKPKVVIWARAI